MEGLQHGLLGLLIGDLLVGVRHNGGIDVVHMQLVHAHDLFSQGHIAVHLIQIAVDCLNEVQIHRHRHLSGVQRGLKGAVVVAGVGEEAQLLELAVQRGGHGVLILAQRLVVGLEGTAAQLPVGAHQHGDEGGVRQLMGIAGLVHHVRIDHIGVAEHAGHVLRGVGHFAGGGQQLLLGRGEDMGLAAADLIQAAAVGLQLRLGGVEQIQGILRDLHDLRGGKGSSAGDGHQRAHGFAAHILIEAVAGVLVALAAGVAIQAAQPLLHLILEPEPCQQVLGGAAQRATEGGDLLREGLQGFVFFIPSLIAFIQVLQVPCVFLRNLTALGDDLVCHI